MDTDTKTLADLSHEAKEKKYVTLDVGSKISGYTKDYLDRLCRLNKIEHRLWVKGGFVVELDSLLRETHTLLLSDEEINFVNKRELVGQIEENAAIPSPPVTAQVETGSIPAAPVEIPAVRIRREPDISLPPISTPAPTLTPASPSPGSGFDVAQSKTEVEQAPVFSMPFPPSPIPPPAVPQPAPPPVFTPPLSPAMPPTPAPSSPQKPPPIAYDDEWDALLLGSMNGANDMPDEFPPITRSPGPSFVLGNLKTGAGQGFPAVLPRADATGPSLYQIPSIYRPIRTSVDPLPHHDPAPLFPFSLEKALKKESAPAEVAPPPSTPIPPRQNPSGQTPSPALPRATTPGISASATAMPPKLGEEHHLAISQPHTITKSHDDPIRETHGNP